VVLMMWMMMMMAMTMMTGVGYRRQGIIICAFN